MRTPKATVRFAFHVSRARPGARIAIESGPAPPSVPKGRIPRVARLVALAHKFQRMIDEGSVDSMAEIARLGHVTRARLTQIMDLTLLAPDIQEALLFVAPVERGRDPIALRALRDVCRTPVWADQRERWAALAARLSPPGPHDRSSAPCPAK